MENDALNRVIVKGKIMISTRLSMTKGCIPVVLALSSFGCATKGYVKAQIAPIDTKIAALDVKTSQQADKEEADFSRLQEKILTTDNRVAQNASAAQQANAAAAQANQLAQQNQAAVAANQAAIDAANASLTNLDKAMTYTLLAKGDVTFDFNKSNLGKTDQAALDALIQQIQSTPRAQFELIGFTDNVGTTDYNLTLSRRRSEAVARYLVRNGVPLTGIHMIGLGKEPVPQALLADAQAVDPNATDANSRRLARRVLVRIYAPNASVQSASIK